MAAAAAVVQVNAPVLQRHGRVVTVISVLVAVVVVGVGSGGRGSFVISASDW